MTDRSGAFGGRVAGRVAVRVAVRLAVRLTGRLPTPADRGSIAVYDVVCGPLGVPDISRRTEVHDAKD